MNSIENLKTWYEKHFVRKAPEVIARDMLIDSGWIEDYYYVEKVMKGNASCIDLRIEFNAFRWGRKTLFKKRELLIAQTQNKLIVQHLINITEEYLDTLRYLDSDMIEKIKENVNSNNNR